MLKMFDPVKTAEKVRVTREARKDDAPFEVRLDTRVPEKYMVINMETREVFTFHTHTDGGVCREHVGKIGFMASSKDDDSELPLPFDTVAEERMDD